MRHHENPTIPSGALIMVGNGLRASCLRNVATATELKLAVENVFEQNNPATRDQGTDRPTKAADLTGGWAAAAGSPRGNIEQTDWHQLNKDRFAREIAAQLYELAHGNRFHQLVIVVPPKGLGHLRQVLHREVTSSLSAEIPKEFTHAPIAVIQNALSP